MSDIRKHMIDVIEDLFMTEDAFTAFNVTLRLQQDFGHDIKHRDIHHDIVAEIESQIQSNWDADNFIMTNVTKDGINFNLYHENTFDPQDFVISKNPNPQSSTKVSNSNPSRRKRAGDTYDNRGRFTVSGYHMDYIAFKGDEVKLVIETDKNCITIQEPHVAIASPTAKVIKMHRHENIFRVSPSHITKAFGKVPASLDVEVINVSTGRKLMITEG